MLILWNEPTATDNSGMVPSRIQSHRPGDIFLVGDTPVTYIFSDQAGNDATCQFVITGNYCVVHSVHALRCYGNIIQFFYFDI